MNFQPTPSTSYTSPICRSLRPHGMALTLLAVACTAACSITYAQTAPVSQGTLAPVVVNVMRSQALAFDTPASLDVITPSADSARWNVNLSELLGTVPGLVANNRNNYAQDLQISSRGFGARTAFGVRGIRIMVDGIPGNSPDGQGQVSHIDLATAKQVEVLRGPFSALYGNASGGVINVTTEEGGPDTLLSTTVSGGSNQSYRVEQKISGSTPYLNYVVSGSRFGTEGWRQQSSAQKDNLNARLGFKLGPDTSAVVVLNRVYIPNAQDAQGVDLAGLANPRAVPAAVLTFDTRKSTEQNQAGIDINHRINAENAVKLMMYGGTRGVTQFQSIAIGAQAAATSAGGVVDFDRTYGGADLRWTWKRNLANGPLLFNAGLSADQMTEQRKGFNNYLASGSVNPDPLCINGTSRLFTCGVQGALRRDETNKLNASDQYLQAQWWPLPALGLHAGLRHSSIRLNSSDHYIATGNPDDSGGATYGGTTPMVGLVYNLSETLNAYASAGKGFDAPTMNEVAYNANAALSGLNTALKASRSQQFELGLKSQNPNGRRWQVAVFQATTEDEIATLSNASGRSRFQNVGKTTRRGMELGYATPIGENFAKGWSTQWAYTYLNAVYNDSFLSCYITTCTPGAPVVANQPQTVASGNLLPGIPKQSLFADLKWRRADGGMEAGLEWRANGRVAVDDLNTQFAAGYGVVAARVSFKQTLGAWTLREFARIDNLGAKNYVGSVIVNQASKQFYEPAMGRTWLVGLNGVYKF